MKKLQQMILVTSALMVASCTSKHHTRIVTDANGDELKIEYSGQVVFNDDSTGIERLEKDGYVEYEHYNRKLKAENDRQGRVVYEINGEQKTNLTEGDKQFITKAVREIIAETAKVK